MNILKNMTRGVWFMVGGSMLIIPSFSFAAFQPASIVSRVGVATPPLNLDIDLAKIPPTCMNPDLKITISAQNTEKTAVRFESVRLYDQSNTPIGNNVASQTDALSANSYAFAFRNFGVSVKQLATVKGVAVSFIDFGGDNPTGFVRVTGVQASVDCQMGEACVVADPSIRVTPFAPPPTVNAIQTARPLVVNGAAAATTAAGGGGSTSEGPYNPGTMANDNTTGTSGWGTVDNAKTTNDSYASVTFLSPGTSNYLKATNFGFAIPGGATVNGIAVTVEKKQLNGSGVTDDKVRLIKGGTIQTPDKAAAGAWPTTDTVSTYGSSSDLWEDATWQATNWNASTSGVVIAVSASGSVTAQVDHISITVYYTPAGASVYDSFMDLLRTLFHTLKNKFKNN